MPEPGQQPAVPPATASPSKPIAIAVAGGFGDSTGHTLYILGQDGDIWARMVAQGKYWVPIPLNTAPTTEPLNL